MGREDEMSDHSDGTSFEAARDELASVVQRLEAGGLALEESLALWQRGEELAGICQRWLDQARALVDDSPGSQGSGP